MLLLFCTPFVNALVLSCRLQNEQFVRPGFELGFKKNGKYYINNHLVFNILVYETHGEFTAAKKRCAASSVGWKRCAEKSKSNSVG